MPIRIILRKLSHAGAMVLALALAAFAGPAATLSGRITDASGGVLPGVRVEAQSLETNLIFSGETNQFGLYSISQIPPGIYRLIVRRLGSKTIVKPGVELHVQDLLTLNFTLQPGSVIESVMAPEGAPLISTEDASLGVTILQRTVAEVPSLTRNPYDFVALAAGATPANVNRGIGF